MRRTEFKEKTYEKYFGHELARLSTFTFSPDEWDEHFLGFDEAFLLPLFHIRRFAPFIRARRWQRMNGMDLHELDRLAPELSRRLPHFRFNLFVQYKRPMLLETPGARQWREWGRSFFRYEISTDQQILLANLERKSATRAAIIYASPAFWTSSDLFDHASAGQIIEKSNVAGAGRLSGHRHYSYVDPGHYGKGHSEVAEIESTPIDQLIAQGLDNEPLPLNQHLKQTAAAIVETVRETAGDRYLFDKAYRFFFDEEIDPNSFTRAWAIIEAFTDAFGVNYYAIG